MSIKLSRLCIAAFALVLAAIDLSAAHLIPWYMKMRNLNSGEVRFVGLTMPERIFLLVTIYVLSLFAWILLYNLWTLLGSMGRSEIFTAENVRRLRIISWCCAGAAVVCAGGSWLYMPFLFICISAAFMMLIVRVVKNAFRDAAEMKSELDLTV